MLEMYCCNSENTHSKITHSKTGSEIELFLPDNLDPLQLHLMQLHLKLDFETHLWCTEPFHIHNFFQAVESLCIISSWNYYFSTIRSHLEQNF